MNTEPTKNLIFKALDAQNDWLKFTAMMKNMPVDERVFRAAIDELIEAREIEIKFGFVRRRLV